ncbi:MAG: class D sortase [Lachnospiraceae bacterium]
MKRLQVCLGSLLFIVCFCMAQVSVNAGGLNGNESSIVGVAQSTFEYDGKYYRVPSSYINQGINYLCQDGVDLTADQAGRVISTMYSLVGEGVRRGYLVLVDGGSSKESVMIEKQQDKTAKEIVKDTTELANELGVKISIDTAGKKVAIVNQDGKSVVSFDGVIKNTGETIVFSPTLITCMILFLVCVLALFIAVIVREKRNVVRGQKQDGGFFARHVYSPLILAILAGMLCVLVYAPFHSMISSTVQMLLVKSVDSYHGGLESVYDEKRQVPDTGKVSMEEIQMPTNEVHYAELSCDRIGLVAPVYFGDTRRVLANGVGQYMGSAIPGMKRPVMLTGHDSTYLSPLQSVEVGDIIQMKTNYGHFTYEVKKLRVAEASDKSAYDLGKKKKQLILYTCYPFGVYVGVKKQRFFVYANQIDGPKVIEEAVS